jgi:hypothetical protein
LIADVLLRRYGWRRALLLDACGVWMTFLMSASHAGGYWGWAGVARMHWLRNVRAVLSYRGLARGEEDASRLWLDATRCTCLRLATGVLQTGHHLVGSGQPAAIVSRSRKGASARRPAGNPLNKRLKKPSFTPDPSPQEPVSPAT